MKKQIKIGGKEYFAKSSAYTQFKYKNDTGHKLLSDLKDVAKLQELDQDGQINEIQDMLDTILRITYIMIEEADSNQVTSYEDFLKDLDGLLDEEQWLADVIELASSPFSRGIKANPQEITK